MNKNKVQNGAGLEFVRHTMNKGIDFVYELFLKLTDICDFGGIYMFIHYSLARQRYFHLSDGIIRRLRLQ